MTLALQITLGLVALLAIVAVWAWTLGPFRVVSLADVETPPVRRTREDALTALAEHVYGPEPARIEPKVTRKESIPPDRAGGVAGVEQWHVELAAAGSFNLVLVLPPQLVAPAPTVIMQSFSGNQAAFHGRPEAIAPPLHWYPWICREPALEPAMCAVFGTHLYAPPYELLAARGYALAMVYGGDVVPDNARDGRAALARFAPKETGALGAWAWLYSRALDVLCTDARLDAQRMAVWGQSRQGKAALLAGARDERFAAIVGLQAGRGGDALTNHRAGESVRGMTQMFPHWFSPRFASYAQADPPVDQHELLAAIAPRPLLTGHAWRDGWADPAGARVASDAAAAIYESMGAARPHFFMRKGRHGIERVDWEETLDFLDAYFKPAPAPSSPLE